MFEMHNTLRLGGSSILDGGSTGAENIDIPTKRYVDLWHSPVDAQNQDDHYQRYIKSRLYTMVPLTGLCKITTTISSTGYISTLLGACSKANTFYFSPNGTLVH